MNPGCRKNNGRSHPLDQFTEEQPAAIPAHGRKRPMAHAENRITIMAAEMARLSDLKKVVEAAEPRG